MAALLQSGIATKFLYLVIVGIGLRGEFLEPMFPGLATGLGWPFIVRFLKERMKSTDRPPEMGRTGRTGKTRHRW